MKIFRRQWLAALTVAVPLLASCNRKPSAVVLPPPPLPAVSITDVPSPASAAVTIARGSNLRDIAAAAYGHVDFSGFLLKLNGLASAETVPAGATLKTPSLAEGLRGAGLDPDYQPAVNALARAWMELITALADYERERSAAHAKEGSAFAITSGLSRRLQRCADDTDAALAVLSHPKPGHQAPQSTVNKFKEASASLRFFAQGKVGSLDYDIFMTGKGYGLGFTYLLIWAQSHHR
jgi:hypothetical protein